MKVSIHTLLRKQLTGEISSDEKQYLQEWMANHPEAKAEYEKLLDNTSLSERYTQYAQVDAEKGWERLQEKITTSNAKIPKKRTLLYRVAAVAIVFIIGGAFWYHRDYTLVTPPEITEQVKIAMQQSQESGWQGGEVISSKATNKPIITQKEQERYHVDEHFAEQLAEAKRVTTYHDKEYWITLDDGTLVHLNYNSRLIYPERFGDRRDVILEGEAYFMVAKDKSRQFVVHTPQGEVKVYGTEFVVNTASDSLSTTSVTLVKGSISFTTHDGKETMMVPNQQLSANNNILSAISVDTAPLTAWNEGKFLFQAWSLERVMNVLSRWYNIKVEFGSDHLRKYQLDGYFSRYDGFDSILESIEAVLNVKIEKSNNTILITEHTSNI